MMWYRTFCREKNKSAGFTLVELLVVISIISVLASLLLPALSKSLEIARKVTCANNQKQIYTGIAMYINDSDGWMPTMNFANQQHFYLINHYLEQNNDTVWGANSYMAKNPVGTYFCPTGNKASESPSWPYGESENSLYFPNYVATVQNPGVPMGPKGGCWTLWGGSVPLSDRRFAAIKEGCVIIVEKNYAGYAGTVANSAGYFVAGNTNAAVTASYSIGWNRHPGESANFLFVDGHIGTYSFTGSRVLDFDCIPEY